MLIYDKHIPAGVTDSAPTIVLLHGRGSDEHDLMGLQPGLPQDAIVVTPRAPFPGAPWGYGDGWAWYRYLGGTTPDPAPFERSMVEIDQLLQALRSDLPVRPGPVILGGFSQGGTTAFGYALSHPGAVNGVLLFSGFLPTHPSVAATPETVAALRIFWGHGTLDDMIPFDFAVEGRAALGQAGADLTAREYPIGHGIVPSELADANRWLQTFSAVSAAATR
jgi:phospholipase/carboxylesterase